jgi:hypothetical protein
MASDDIRATLLDIAIVYDSMADRAARREDPQRAKKQGPPAPATN